MTESPPDEKRKAVAGIGLVVIGRNEGERLRRSLETATRPLTPCVYVDSGSNDGSPEFARSLGVPVVELDESRPYTAARSRNAGLHKLLELYPNLEHVQFLDGDCELVEGWLPTASHALQDEEGVAVVCGTLLERHPEASVYNRLCAIEWQGPAGEIQACGGNAMYRVVAIREVDGFREDLIAGEEPELCLRLRRLGWRVLRIAEPMAFHDAAMLHFSQWWTRCVRSGHTYAQAAWLHGRSSDRFGLRNVARNWLWGLGLPLLAIGGATVSSGFSLLLFLAYPALYLRIRQGKQREGFSRSDAGLYARYCVLGKFGEAIGQCKFVWNSLLSRRSQLIEYK